MKTRLFAMFLMTFVAVSGIYAWKAKKVDFKAVSAQGFEYSFAILSEADKTVELLDADSKASKFEGELILPGHVEHNGATYTVTVLSFERYATTGSPFRRVRASKIVIPSTVKVLKHQVFFCGKKLKQVELPEGLEEIGDYVFQRCEQLEEINFPSTLKKIGAYAFYRTNLKTLNIPNSVKNIGENAFAKPVQNPRAKLTEPQSDPAPKQYEITNVPLVVTEGNCETMGISKMSMAAYLVDHPRNTQPQVIYAQGAAPVKEKQAEKKPSSDVDINIPVVSASNENTFAVIFANENYQEEVKVDYALNDGEMFKQYCHKVLGLPEDNVHLRKDATLNNMRSEIEWISKVAEAYNGSAKIIIYYAGHGAPDEKTGTSYLLPVDGKSTMPSSGLSLTTLYQTLGSLPVRHAVVLMDACFSGAKRGDGMLASARGVAIKAKPQSLSGKLIVFSAAQGDETAYPLKDKEHGLFTYFLLKKLKDTKGNCSLLDLSNYVVDQVKRKSIVSNGKSQTPTISSSMPMQNNWQTIKLR